MKLVAKSLTGLFIVLTCATVLSFLINTNSSRHFLPISNKVKKIKHENYDNNNILAKVKLHGRLIKEYALKHHYNSAYCFMIDMNIESGRNRFFVYNIKSDSVEILGLVAHGQSLFNDNAVHFSNTPGSFCTSLGKYEIGYRYNGQFGPAYKLYGLDNTNNKAQLRNVVLHAHACVPNEEVSPQGICQSQGCPTVSPEFLRKLSFYLNDVSAPVLLYIYV